MHALPPPTIRRDDRSITPPLLLVSLAFLLACNEIADYDIWWHLRTGSLIPERGVPRTDWFSFTSAGRSWINVHWGFQLAAWWVYSSFGAAGMVVAKACLAAAAVGLALWSTSGSGSASVRALFLLPPVVLMSSRFYERPEIVTLVLLAAFLGVLLRTESHPRLALLLPILMALWANVQGLFALGIVLLALYWCEVLLRLFVASLWPKSRVEYQGSVLILVIATLLTLAATMASPYGFGNILYVFDIWTKMDPQAGEFFRSYIAELQDMRSFLADGGWRFGYFHVFLIVMAMGVLGIVASWRQIAGGEIFRPLAVIAFTWLGWQAIRNGSQYALVVGAISAGSLVTWWPNRWSITWARRLVGALCIIIAILFVTGIWQVAMGSHRRFGFDLHPQQYSFEAMDACRQPGMPDRAAVFHLGHAATYIYACGPDRKVFMDARLELHPEEMLRAYRDLQVALETDGAWQRSLGAYGIDVVVASGEQNSGIQVTLLNDPAWKCVHWDDVAAVFARARSTPRETKTWDPREFIFESGPTSQQDFAVGPTADSFWPPWQLSRPTLEERRVASLSRLVQAMVGRGDPLSRTLPRISWATYRLAASSLSDPDEDRWAAILVALHALSMAHSTFQNDDQPDRLGAALASLTAAKTRAFVKAFPDNWTIAFLFQDRLDFAGAVDESIDLLKAIFKRPVRNKAQRLLRERLAPVVSDRRELLEATGDAPQGARARAEWFWFADYGRLGHLAEMLQQDKELIAILSENERLALIDRMLSIGRVDLAQELVDFTPTNADATSERAWLQVNIALSQGNWDSAKEALEAVPEGDENRHDRLLMQCLISLLEGDMHQFQSQVSALPSDLPGRARHHWLSQFRDVMIEEPDER